jgi:hypothetical protein
MQSFSAVFANRTQLESFDLSVQRRVHDAFVNPDLTKGISTGLKTVA